MIDFAYVVCVGQKLKIKFFKSTESIEVKSLRDAEDKLEQLIKLRNRKEKIKEILDENQQ